MQDVILFDHNVNRRQFVADCLQQTGFVITECYSIPKLERLLSQADSRVYLVIGPKAEQEFVTLAKEKGHEIVAFDDTKDLPCIVFQIRTESARKNLDRKRLTAKSVNSVGYDLIVIGSSTGGLPVVQTLLEGINAKNSVIVVCQHISRELSNQPLEAVKRKARAKVELVEKSCDLQSGQIYVLAGGQDYQLKIKYGNLHIAPLPEVVGVYHPSFNTLVKSASELSNFNIACVILSGLGDDGQSALKSLERKKSFTVLAQDPLQSIAPFMPEACIKTGKVDRVMSVDDLRDLLRKEVS